MLKTSLEQKQLLELISNDHALRLNRMVDGHVVYATSLHGGCTLVELHIVPDNEVGYYWEDVTLLSDVTMHDLVHMEGVRLVYMTLAATIDNPE